jgi:pimeloyl-ACP methyl ester carboxylesterase
VAETTWILLRGLARETGHFGHFIPLARRAMPDATIVPLDFPGTGTRLNEEAPRTLDEMVERLRDEAKPHVANGKPLFLFGLSMGGMATIAWADRHPDEVSGIVVGGSSARNLAKPLQRFRPRGLAAVWMNRLTRDHVRREARMVRLLTHTRDHYDETVRLWGQIARDRPLTEATVRAQVGAAGRWQAPPTLKTPALFIVGARDRLVDPACTYALAAHFKTHAIVHPDAGHDLTTDAGEWCVEQMQDLEESVLRRGPRIVAKN